MEERDRKTELLVGFFLLFGLLLVAGLILKFSSVLEVFKNTYTVTALFSSGAGINDGTPLMLGGTKIGKVKDKPKLNATFDGVIIQLEVYNSVHIPVDAKFTIATAGLLGDSYVEIKPSGKETTTFVQPGAVIQGESSKLANLQATADQLAKKVDVAMDDIRAAIGDLRLSLKRINEGALSEDGMRDLKESFKHINSVTARLDEKTLGEETSKDIKDAIASFKNAAHSLEDATKKFDPVMAKADSAMKKVDGVVEKADKVMTTADTALKSIDKTANTVTEAVKDVRTGRGLFAALVNDPALKQDFRELIANLKEHGVLWYRNDAARRSAEAAAASAAAKKERDEEQDRGRDRSRSRYSTGTKR